MPRVRQAAHDWRNGAGALVAGILSFSLIKGKSDLAEVAEGWAVFAGALLALSLLLGLSASFLILRASHGLPLFISVDNAQTSEVREYLEAIRSTGYLRLGIKVLTASLFSLAFSVAVVWYAPEREQDKLVLATPAGSVCGTILMSAEGSITILTEKEPRTPILVQFREVTDMHTTPDCVTAIAGTSQ